MHKITINRYNNLISCIGGISKHEMLRTFNCGIGAVLICSEKDKAQILDKLKDENPVVIGSVNAHRNYSCYEYNYIINYIKLFTHSY